jgi:hypothetical protein
MHILQSLKIDKLKRSWGNKWSASIKLYNNESNNVFNWMLITKIVMRNCSDIKLSRVRLRVSQSYELEVI